MKLLDFQKLEDKVLENNKFAYYFGKNISCSSISSTAEMVKVTEFPSDGEIITDPKTLMFGIVVLSNKTAILKQLHLRDLKEALYNNAKSKSLKKLSNKLLGSKYEQ